LKIFRKYKKEKTIFIRKNNQIKAFEVRLIDEEGNQVGVVPTAKALDIAREKQLDLIEISPKVKPPICKLGNYGSFLFNKKKAKKKQQSATTKITLKSIRFGIRISKHDLEVKIARARKFLEKNFPVKLLLQFRGREGAPENAKLGFEKLNIFIEQLADISKIEAPPKRMGNRVNVTLRPEKISKK